MKWRLVEGPGAGNEGSVISITDLEQNISPLPDSFSSVKWVMTAKLILPLTAVKPCLQIVISFNKVPISESGENLASPSI